MSRLNAGFWWDDKMDVLHGSTRSPPCHSSLPSDLDSSGVIKDLGAVNHVSETDAPGTLDVEVAASKMQPMEPFSNGRALIEDATLKSEVKHAGDAEVEESWSGVWTAF